MSNISPKDFYLKRMEKKKSKFKSIIIDLIFILVDSLVCFGLLILGNEFSYALIGTSIILGIILNYLNSILKQLIKLNEKNN